MDDKINSEISFIKFKEEISIVLKAMETLGAKLVKNNVEFLFFDVTIGSEIDDIPKMQVAKKTIFDRFGYKIKIRYVK